MFNVSDLIVDGNKSIKGVIKGGHLPGDKSISHRILLAAILTPGVTIISNINRGNAVQLLIPALEKLGIDIYSEQNGEVHVRPFGERMVKEDVPVLNLGPSSAAARMLIGILAGLRQRAVIDGDHVLRTRPMEWVVNPLRQMGAEITYLGKDGCLPLEIHHGNFNGGSVRLKIGSAQASSAIMFAAFASGCPVEITHKVRSRDHTERLLGYIGATIKSYDDLTSMTDISLGEIPYYHVPGDPSSAAFIAAAHVLQKRKCDCFIENVCLNPTRVGFFEILKKCGISIHYQDVKTVYGEPVGNIVIGPYNHNLTAFTVEGGYKFHSLIDEVPLLAAIACVIKGASYILNAAELVFKETNRLQTTKDMLRAFGADVEIANNGLYINGGKELESGVVPSFNDHRIAMTAAALASSLPGITRIIGGDCYQVSFVEFPNVMHSYGFW